MIFEITVRGAVQGVGFRPYIHSLAKKLNIKGCVYNEAGIVKIIMRGEETDVREFTDTVRDGAGALAGADVNSITYGILSDAQFTGRCLPENIFEDFSIVESSPGIDDMCSGFPVILPDMGICGSCLEEMLEPSNRRYKYPLISCTSCGPRYSIIKALPYDRERTTMSDFTLCPDCGREYAGVTRKSGSSLRHHAQTISCYLCGPQYIFKTKAAENESFYGRDESSPIDMAIAELLRGNIVGLKGTAGYQLLVSPYDTDAVGRLRELKGREKKPFAVMFSKAEDIREYCEVCEEEEKILKSAARPIVLLEKKRNKDKPEREFATNAAGESRYIGAFLPSVGIHALLCDALGALIVTSANVSDEPIIIDDERFDEVFLNKIAGVLYHQRRILSPADDSVVFYLKDKKSMQFIRRARGYAPLGVKMGDVTAATGEPGEKSEVNITQENQALSYGADLKGCFCFSRGKNTVLSQYFGDLEDYAVKENYLKEIERAGQLFKFKPELILCDKHPLYVSSQSAENYAKIHDIPLIKVQHHHAHAASVMAENGWDRALGVVFDGTGYGEDGRLWGGEFLLCDKAGFKRVGQLKYLTLCGGDRASTDAGLTAQCYMEAAGVPSGGRDNEKREAELVRTALKNKINTIESSSMGRLFDAISCLLGIREKNSYEGECAIALENAAAEFIEKSGSKVDVIERYKNSSYSTGGVDIKNNNDEKLLRFPVFTDDEGVLQADQIKMTERLLCRHNAGNHSQVMKTSLAFEFHLAIIEMVRHICIKIRENNAVNRVVLSGGCFVNKILLNGCIDVLKDEKFEVAWNTKVPSNDGGISLGQAYIASFRGE